MRSACGCGCRPLRVREPGGPRLHEQRVRAVAGVEVRREVVEHGRRPTSRGSRAPARCSRTRRSTSPRSTSPTNVRILRARRSRSPSRAVTTPRRPSATRRVPEVGASAASWRSGSASCAVRSGEPATTSRARRRADRACASAASSASAGRRPAPRSCRHLVAQRRPVAGERAVGQVGEQAAEVLAERRARGLRRRRRAFAGRERARASAATLRASPAGSARSSRAAASASTAAASRGAIAGIGEHPAQPVEVVRAASGTTRVCRNTGSSWRHHASRGWSTQSSSAPCIGWRRSVSSWSTRSRRRGRFSMRQSGANSTRRIHSSARPASRRALLPAPATTSSSRRVRGLST